MIMKAHGKEEEDEEEEVYCSLLSDLELERECFAYCSQQSDLFFLVVSFPHW